MKLPVGLLGGGGGGNGSVITPVICGHIVIPPLGFTFKGRLLKVEIAALMCSSVTKKERTRASTRFY